MGGGRTTAAWAHIFQNEKKSQTGLQASNCTRTREFANRAMLLRHSRRLIARKACTYFQTQWCCVYCKTTHPANHKFTALNFVANKLGNISYLICGMPTMDGFQGSQDIVVQRLVHLFLSAIRTQAACVCSSRGTAAGSFLVIRGPKTAGGGVCIVHGILYGTPRRLAQDRPACLACLLHRAPERERQRQRRRDKACASDSRYPSS